MRLPIVAALLALGSAQVRADIIELSPNLYLLMRTTHGSMVKAKLDTISEANEFAKSKGGVAVPVMWRVSSEGIMYRVAEYQFRVMSRDEALAARPSLADAVITVENTGHCAPSPAVTALLPDLHGIKSINSLDLLGRLPPPEAPKDEQAMPGTLCQPGTVCTPEMQCLPGMQCTPGVPSMPLPPEPMAPPASTQ